MSKDDINQLVHQQVEARFKMWSGPLPSPSDLQDFDHVVPGSGAKIIDSFVDQGKHRRQLEKAVVEGSEKRADRGQLLVFAFLTFVVICGLVVAIREDGAAGALIITAGLGSAVGLYFIGGRTPKDE